MTRGMVIVETRIIPNFKEVLMNHYQYTQWPILIFHGHENESYVKECAKHIPGTEFRLIKSRISDAADYNALLTDERFWNQIPWDKVLIFQSDSWLLRPGIEQYMQYDFIGAPLYHIDFPAMNGGLSLRDKSAMINIINTYPYQLNYGNEDIYFSTRCNDERLPAKEIAETFSVETICGFGSFGVHAIDKWQDETTCKLILNQYR